MGGRGSQCWGTRIGVVVDRAATAGNPDRATASWPPIQRPAIARRLQAAAYTDKSGVLFLVFFAVLFKNKIKSLACSKGLGFLRGVGCIAPHLPLHLEVLILPKFMESGDFI
jgi:hypothetical protein